jgi:hypothetical protein
MLSLRGNARWNFPIFMSKPLALLTPLHTFSTVKRCIGGMYSNTISNHSMTSGTQMVTAPIFSILNILFLLSIFICNDSVGK